MKKIKTIFERDWDGDRTVIDKLAVDFDFANAVATEKLDGMNVRVTVRSHTSVRLEKRRNPDKRQKASGIEDPWYIDADEYGPEDKYLYEALKNTALDDIPDGEWSGEAVGPSIQGNPLRLDSHRIVLFSCEKAPVRLNVPTTYAELKEWIKIAPSMYGNDCGIEGIVWHAPNGDMVKIKASDFERDKRLSYEGGHGKPAGAGEK